MTELKTQIQEALSGFAGDSFAISAKRLLNVLGYESERTFQLSPNNYEGFKELFQSGLSNFDAIKARTKDWQTIDIIFQLTEDDIKKTHSLFETKKYSDKIIESYLFFALSLKGDTYTRGDLVRITREINKLTPMPAMILFKYNNYLTLAVIDRRLHKRESTKDVLEKVTLIKDIQIPSPSPTGEGRGEVHRAHIEILHDLSIDELQRKTGFSNFIELHNAWRKTLDTSELNKKFFRELANWYFWALSNVEFPDDAEKNRDVRNAISVIRMITRLIFIWFVKEKGLVPDELFNHAKLKNMLNFTDKNQSTYYKAILQNLFFATLNTEMGIRKFRGKRQEGRDQHYMIHNVFRYADFFKNPDDTLKKYFENIPFLNGGLFECLDKEISSTLDKAPSHTPTLEKGGKGGFSDKKIIRIDAFSDRMDNPLNVPDYLFFSSEQAVDLNEIYGTKNKTYKVRGLIDIFDSYKFTVDENTPIEEEIALDPELLGKVFENLLASYNPETQTTARKQTGSFYTPREIVNYMVDESIIAYLTQALSKGEGSHNGDNQATPGWMTTNTGTYIGLKEFVKENRKNQTPAEGLLWEKLRNNQLGVKFRRQHPIGKFIADFVCLDKNLIIETDGGIHNEQKESDEQRDKTLLELGYRTVRFTNDEVIHDMEAVLKKIRDEVHALPLSPSSLERDGVRLRHLIAYNDDLHKFTPAEVNILIEAINSLKALDPACGSGAFPMGMLHKLVYILGKLDPDNSKWRELQKQKAIKETEEAYSIGDMDDRNKRLQDISEVFENNASDYGRKLYLIENCIFGVDIQPIAVQIAKLRFFVSLIVDQRIDPKKANLGVRPLPNLETKFVAANTLIGIEKPAQMLLRNPEIDKKEDELKKVRERHFTARTPQTKEKYRKADERLRAEISELLKKDGFPSEMTEKLARWNPYDQNASADFFDSEWMFGITCNSPLEKGDEGGCGGFDVVIGNPPYGADIDKEVIQKLIKSYKYYDRQKNSASFFIEIASRLSKKNAVITYIVPKSLSFSEGWDNTRQLISVTNTLHIVIDASKAFENVLLEAIIISFINKKGTNYSFNCGECWGNEVNITGSSTNGLIKELDTLPVYVSTERLLILRKISQASVLLSSISKTFRGLPLQSKISKSGDPILRGKNIGKYRIYREIDRISLSSDFLQSKKVKDIMQRKIVSQNIVAHVLNPYDRIIIMASLDMEGVLTFDTVMNTILTSDRYSYEYILALLNSQLAAWFYYWFVYNRAVRTMHFDKYYIDKLPIREIDMKAQQPFVTLVEQILTAKKQQPPSSPFSKGEFKEADTSALEKQIDEMVYALYGLTPEEIAIVEGKG